MTIEQAIPEGAMSIMAHVNADKVATLFPDENAISDFDTKFLADLAEATISYQLNRAIVANGVDAFMGAVLSMYYDSWLRIKDALEAEYDLLWTGGGDNTTTETRHEQGTNKDSENVQNQLNAFNGADASDTDNQNREGEGEHDVTTTIERKVERKENSVTYTQAEVIEKELNLRMKYRFFDIVEQDLRRELCAEIY